MAKVLAVVLPLSVPEKVVVTPLGLGVGVALTEAVVGDVLGDDDVGDVLGDGPGEGVAVDDVAVGEGLGDAAVPPAASTAR
jgi:hypothetical protein